MRIKLETKKSLKIKGGYGDGMHVAPEKTEAKAKTEKHYHKKQMTKMLGYIKEK